MQVLFLPILGAIADYSHLRKRMMQIFATIGAIATILMFFVTGDLWWLGGVLFIVANLAFGAAIVFYNAYLPDIASEEETRPCFFVWLGHGISGRRCFAGAQSGFLYFQRRPWRTEQIWLSALILHRLVFGGLDFHFITWSRLRPRHAARQLPAGETYVSIGFKQLRKTFSEVKHLP